MLTGMKITERDKYKTADVTECPLGKLQDSTFTRCETISGRGLANNSLNNKSSKLPPIAAKRINHRKLKFFLTIMNPDTNNVTKTIIETLPSEVMSAIKSLNQARPIGTEVFPFCRKDNKIRLSKFIFELIETNKAIKQKIKILIDKITNILFEFNFNYKSSALSIINKLFVRFK